MDKRPVQRPRKALWAAARAQVWKGVSPRARNRAVSGARSSSRAARAPMRPMAATTTAASRSTEVMAKVRSKISREAARRDRWRGFPRLPSRGRAARRRARESAGRPARGEEGHGGMPRQAPMDVEAGPIHHGRALIGPVVGEHAGHREGRAVRRGWAGRGPCPGAGHGGRRRARRPAGRNRGGAGRPARPRRDPLPGNGRPPGCGGPCPGPGAALGRRRTSRCARGPLPDRDRGGRFRTTAQVGRWPRPPRACGAPLPPRPNPAFPAGGPFPRAEPRHIRRRRGWLPASRGRRAGSCPP